MDIILYIIIFITGILFGSFYTLSVHRIPKKQDIIHTHSYCPKCDHKLGFLDLIPLFSYIFLRGKCRYCKEKIRPRYFIIEIISGIFFVIMAYLLGLSVENITINKIAEFSFFVLYFTFIVLMAGIDKENRKINKSITVYGIIISIIYVLYLCLVEKANIYRYILYMIFYVIILVLDTITLRKKAVDKYVYGVLLCLIVMTIFTGEYVVYNTILVTLLAIAIYILLGKIEEKLNKAKKTDIMKSQNISIGYYLAISNIIYFIFILFFNKYLI